MKVKLWIKGVQVILERLVWVKKKHKTRVCTAGLVPGGERHKMQSAWDTLPTAPLLPLWRITKMPNRRRQGKKNTVSFISKNYISHQMCVTITGLSSGKCLQRQMQLCFFLPGSPSAFPPSSCEIVYFLHGLPGYSGSCVISNYSTFSVFFLRLSIQPPVSLIVLYKHFRDYYPAAKLL